MNKSVIFVIFAGFTMVSFNSVAGTIRCGSKVFSSTDRISETIFDIQKACGEPTKRIGDVWLYQKEGKRLRFIDGLLVEITDITK